MSQKKSRKSESSIVDNIREAIETSYPRSITIKIHGGLFQAAGIPDILACVKGRFIAIEVKKPGKEDTQTKIQKRWIRNINYAGGIAFMATSHKQVLKKLKGELK